MTRIVFCGEGITIVRAAIRAKQKRPGYSVVLVTPHAELPCLFPVAELISDHLRPEWITHHAETLLAHHRIEHIVGALSRLDREKKILHTNTTAIQYDSLVLETPYHDHRHARERARVHRAHTPYEIRALRQHIVNQLLHARAATDSAYRTVVVVGAGARGIAIAGEVKTLIAHTCEHHQLFSDETSVIVVEQEPPPAAIHEKIKTTLTDNGIEYYTDHVRSTEFGVELSDRLITTNTIIWTAAEPAPSIFSHIGLAHDEHGYPVVDSKLQTSDPYILVLREPDDGNIATTRLSKCLAYNALKAAEERPLLTYRPSPPIYLIALGSHHALLSTHRFSWVGSTPYRWSRALYATRRTLLRLHK